MDGGVNESSEFVPIALVSEISHMRSIFDTIQLGFVRGSVGSARITETNTRAVIRSGPLLGGRM
jgi:hypothetical protein